MNRSLLKAQAREIIRASRQKILIASFLFLALTVLFSILTYLLTGPSYSQMQEYVKQLNEAGPRQYMDLMMQISGRKISGFEAFAADLLSIVESIVGVGFLILLLRAVRGQDFSYGNLMDGFSMWWRIILLDFLTSLLITLWSALLIVPGILAAYRYRMARYLLITHPEYSFLDCILESKRRMKGHKWEMFVLDLSFFGWFLLVGIPVLGWILAVWLEPYVECTNLLYYEAISAPYDSEPDSSYYEE